MLSVSIECAQVWIPDRVSSTADVYAQVAGTAIGIVLWLLTGGIIENWIADFRTARRPLQRAELMLRACFVAIVLSNLLPFDLTLNPYDIWSKFQNGKIVLIPFRGFVWSDAAVFELLLKALTGIPIGMLAVSIGTHGRRLPLHAAVVGVGLVALIELAQLFVESRFSSTTDVLVGGVGACFGVWIEKEFLAGPVQRLPTQSAPQLRGLLAAAYLVFPCVVLWWPLDFSIDGSMIKAKLQTLADLPLSQLIMGQSYLRGISQITERVSLFLPFGVLVGASLPRRSPLRMVNPRKTFLAGFLVVVAAAVFVEAGQVFVPERTPDGADVLLAVIGGTAGLAVHRLITRDDFGAVVGGDRGVGSRPPRPPFR